MTHATGGEGGTIDRVALTEVEARMRPGEFSQAGFLGPHESLDRVLEMDARALRALGLSAATMAKRLAGLLAGALDTKRTRASIGDFRIRIQRYKGVQICPFAPDPHANPCPFGIGLRFASIDWEILNKRTGVRLLGPGLIVHLVGAHAFFEGLQSPYRVSPRALAELLDLGPFENASS